MIIFVIFAIFGDSGGPDVIAVDVVVDVVAVLAYVLGMSVSVDFSTFQSMNGWMDWLVGWLLDFQVSPGRPGLHC